MPGNTATSAANTKVPAHVGWTRCSPLCSQAGKNRSSVFSCLVQVLRECCVTRLSFCLCPVRCEWDSLYSFFTHDGRPVAMERNPRQQTTASGPDTSATDYSAWSDSVGDEK